MDAVEKTIQDTIPLVEAGLKAKHGLEFKVIATLTHFITHKKENFRSVYGKPDARGCVDVEMSWTEVNTFKIEFFVQVVRNGRILHFSYTLGTYVTTEKKESKERNCPGDRRLASVLEYDGPKEFALNKKEQGELIAFITKSMPPQPKRRTQRRRRIREI